MQKKLKKVRKYLRGWGTNLRGQTLKNKFELIDELKDLEELEEMQFE